MATGLADSTLMTLQARKRFTSLEQNESDLSGCDMSVRAGRARRDRSPALPQESVDSRVGNSVLAG
jgi:hypothetical protein